jgi:hypothetical protein
LTEERDAWLKAAIGVNIDALRKAADAKKSRDTVSDVVGRTTATASQVVRNVKEVKGLRKLGSGSDRATPLYDRANALGEDEIPESPAQPLDDHKEKPWFEDTPPPPPKPDPKIVSHSDETFEVPADTVDTFLERANAHLGGKKEAGHTNITFDTSPTIKDGKCVRAGVTVTTKITRPVWGGGRPPSDDHKKAIQKAVQLIKEHEGRHRQAAIDVATQVVADAVGKTQTAAEAILNQIGMKSSDAQVALDAKEGKISSVDNGKDVQLGPAN